MTDFAMGCLSLFNNTFNAMWAVPVFRFFFMVILFAAVVLFFDELARGARR